MGTPAGRKPPIGMPKQAGPALGPRKSTGMPPQARQQGPGLPGAGGPQMPQIGGWSPGQQNISGIPRGGAAIGGKAAGSITPEMGARALANAGQRPMRMF